MRLGISSFTYGWAVGVDASRPASALSAADLIGRAAEFGVKVLQLCDNLPGETFTDASVLSLSRRAEAAGVSLEIGTRGCKPDHLRRFIRHAVQCKSRFLRAVPDTRDDEPDEEEVIARLRHVRTDLEAFDVRLGIENHDRFPSATLARIVRALGTPYVGICLDTVNSFGALEGPRVVVETLGPHVVNLHLKDFAVRRFPHLQGFTIEGRPAGQGMLDIPWLLGRLKEMGRDCSAVLELWTPPENSLELTVAKEAEWARRSVAAARQWVPD